MYTVLMIIQCALVIFQLFCTLKVKKSGDLSIALRDEEIAELKFKLSLLNGAQQSTIGELEFEFYDKNGQLSALKEKQMILTKKITQLEVEIEIEKLLTAPNHQLLK